MFFRLCRVLQTLDKVVSVSAPEYVGKVRKCIDNSRNWFLYTQITKCYLFFLHIEFTQMLPFFLHIEFSVCIKFFIEQMRFYPFASSGSSALQRWQ